jgi:dihydropyrimidine dehydrogenase (NAD+) subunit PreT
MVVASLASVAAAGLGLEHRRQRAGRRTLARAQEMGLGEPPSLHPLIDPSRCVGCGSCVEACPEDDALRVLEGQARLVNPAHCVGHGRCKSVCPTSAIELVFGTAARGVEVPVLGSDLQSSVPGIYVAGELGGFGLIRTAVNQGVQAVENLSADLGPTREAGVVDVAIVGAGPAGIAAALACRERGLSHAMLDQDGLGGSVLHFPRRKLVMTAPVDLPVVGRMGFGEVEKETLMKFWVTAARRAQLRIEAPARVTAIERQGERFEVRWDRGSIRARRVILAIGRRGTPRKLGAPGEERSKVAYRLLEPEQFSGRRALVVGGGNSAVEAAVALAEAGAATVLSYRGEALGRVAEANAERLKSLIGPSLELLLRSEVDRIEEESVTLRVPTGRRAVANDHVFVMIGGELPTQLLTRIGVATATYHGEPPRAPLPGRTTASRA